MQTLEQKLDAIFASLESLKAKEDRPLPSVLTFKRAAFELSIGLTKLKSLVRAGKIATCEVGDRKGIPSSEILRIARPQGASAPMRSGGRKAQPKYDVNAELAKLDAATKKRRRR